MGKVVSNERVMQAIPEEVWSLARAHAAEQLENEVGGFLIGFLAEDGLTVTLALPAREAVGSAAQLTFPPEAWTTVYASIEERNKGERLVGWYHSHPGHGVFLSAYDQFIHTQFFPEEGQIAIVVDPQTGEEGVFVTRNNKIQDVIKRSGAKAKGQTRAQQAAKRDRRSLFFRAGAVVILVGAFASFGLIRSGYNSGFADGDTSGYSRGDTAGFARGYDEGDSAGYARGYSEGETDGYDSGFRVGRRSGVTLGRDSAIEEYGPFVPAAVTSEETVRLSIEYASKTAALAAQTALSADTETTTEVVSISSRWFLVIDVVGSNFTASSVDDLMACVANPQSCSASLAP
jgi:proteasome lid subunit RPN8/RPN11